MDESVQQTVTKYRFAGDVNPVIIVAVVLLIALFAYYCYRREEGSDSKRLKHILSVFRIVLFVILILMFLEPIIREETPITHRSKVIIMLDDSLSMGIEEKRERTTEEGNDGEEEEETKVTRLTLLKEAFADKKLDLLQKIGDVQNTKIYKFSDILPPQAIEPDQISELKPTGSKTMLPDSLKAVLKKLRGHNISAFVIFSDGNFNGNKFSIDKAAAAAREEGNVETGIPVFTIGVGSTEQPKDMEIVSVEASEMVLLGDIVQVEAIVSGKGFKGKEKKIFIREKGTKTPIAEETIRFSEDGKPEKLRLGFSATKIGTIVYEVYIPNEKEELFSENNSHSLTVQVTKAKIKVLYVEGRPRWEYRFLKTMLQREKTIDPTILLQKTHNTLFLEGTKNAMDAIDGIPEDDSIKKYDVIILGDITSDIFQPSQYENLAKFVYEYGGGFMMIAGVEHSPASFEKVSPITKMLPIIINPNTKDITARPIKEAFKLFHEKEITEEPILRLGYDADSSAMIWEKLPGFYWHYQANGKKLGAEIIASHPFDLVDGDRTPIFAKQFYGKGRVFYSGIDETWRWRKGIGDRYFHKFWNEVIRFLAEGKRMGKKGFFELTTDKNSYLLNEKVKISLKIKVKELLSSVKDSSIIARIGKGRTEELSVTLTQNRIKENEFVGEFAAVMPGSFEAWVEGLGAGVESITSKPFEVKMPAVEYNTIARNDAKMKKLASLGGAGGEYILLPDVNKLPEILSKHERNEKDIKENTRPMWNKLWVLMLFTLLLITEWVVRKLNRML